ncbi:MAG: thioredoxin domain-containing protein [Candidatus Hodarchaeota archaeon]
MSNNQNKNENFNALINETSPYLLQHASNPVEWYSWEQGLQKANEKNKPLLISIGYAACHWCHVMARESFEDSETAALMNEYFINIKIDREERPDLDSYFQTAVALLTAGRGGWPLTVFCTPDGKAFAGGTYFPKTQTYGLPSFKQVLEYIHKEYQKNRTSIQEVTNKVIKALEERNKVNLTNEIKLSQDLIDRHLAHLIDKIDPIFGGFGLSGPKFPQISDLRFLLVSAYRRSINTELLEKVTKTFDNMAAGGIYDHLGSGFHRYSVDRKWLIPHFEKMLYDNAQLLFLSLELFQATKNQGYADIAQELLDYLKKEMMDESNSCFYSSQDADSEGKEGEFFVWTPEEINSILGVEKGMLFSKYYDVTEGGNFERGKSILNETATLRSSIDNGEITWEEIIQLKQILFEYREKRPKPFLNKNIIVSWNALVFQALARASFVLNEPKHLERAEKGLNFILKNLKDPATGRLYRNFHGKSKVLAFSEDYSLLIHALLEIFAVSGKRRYLEEAIQLQNILDTEFWDDKSNGYYLTGSWQDELSVREKPVVVFSIPSTNAICLENLLKLYHYTSNDFYLIRADSQAQFLASWEETQGYLNGDAFIALDLYINKPIEIISIIGKKPADIDSTEEYLRTNYLPQSVFLQVKETLIDELQDLPLLELRIISQNSKDWSSGTTFICKNFVCSVPLRNGTEIGYYLNESKY